MQLVEMGAVRFSQEIISTGPHNMTSPKTVFLYHSFFPPKTAFFHHSCFSVIAIFVLHLLVVFNVQTSEDFNGQWECSCAAIKLANVCCSVQLNVIYFILGLCFAQGNYT